MSTVNPHAPACTAKGDTCQNPAVAGSTVCRSHGGSAPQVRKAARRRLAVAEADKALRELEYEPVADPVAELADIAGQAKALMAWAGARVADLGNLLRSEGEIEQLRAEVGVYERAMDRTAKLVEACARLGLEERRVQLEEDQADLAVAALRLACERAGLVPATVKQVVDAWSVAVVELESVNAGAPK